MIHKLVGLIIFAALVIFGLSAYLSPDDLGKMSRRGRR